MGRFVRAIVAVASLAIFLAVAASAQTQIKISASKNGMTEFSCAGSTTVTLVGSCGEMSCVPGDAYRGANAGTRPTWLTGTKPLILAAPNPNLFAVNMKGGTLNFSFSPGPGAIQGTTQLTVLRDGTSASQFPGTIPVSSASRTFASLWRSASVVPLNIPTATARRESALVNQMVSGLSGSASVAIAGGAFPSAPEPASIALIGSGLLALGGVLKRRLRR